MVKVAQAKKELDSIGWKGDVHSDIMKDSKDKAGAKRLAAVRVVPFPVNFTDTAVRL